MGLTGAGIRVAQQGDMNAVVQVLMAIVLASIALAPARPVLACETGPICDACREGSLHHPSVKHDRVQPVPAPQAEAPKPDSRPREARLAAERRPAFIGQTVTP